MVDLTGQTFGDLTVIERAYREGDCHVFYYCQCSCGAPSIVRDDNLKGRSYRCAGYRTTATYSFPIHKTTMDDAEERTRITWDAVVKRCLQPASSSYHYYGGRGITMSEEWLTYETFRADMGLRPPGTTLDRIDNMLGYAKGNCRWATPKEQAANKLPKGFHQRIAA